MFFERWIENFDEIRFQHFFSPTTRASDQYFLLKFMKRLFGNVFSRF